MANRTEQKCWVCNKGIIKRGIILFIKTNSFYECNHCHTEFHKQGGNFLLENVPNNSSWNKYEGKLLSLKEIKQIAQGGLSDPEIIQQQAEKEKHEMEKKQGEERRIKEEQEEEEKRIKEEEEEEEWQKQQEQTPGTPQNYLLRFKEILGMEGDNGFELAVQAKNEEEIKQYIKHIGQLQKELKQLKKEIAVTKKQIKSEYEDKKSEISSTAAIYGSSRAVTSIRTREKQLLDRQRDLQFKAYDIVISQIDSTILLFDKGKIEIQNQWMGLKIGDTGGKKKKGKGVKEISEVAGEVKLEDVLTELDNLIGLDNVKAEVQELTDFLKIQELRKSRNLPTPGLSLHVVFYGNPGTGKTTVARLLSKIYKGLGILSKGHLVETDRSGMVAGYVGQTALKVSDVAEKAFGGVLFIDEAYALTENDKGGYGSEAVDTLIKIMEDHREDLAVVIAGYTGKIESFLSSNPGLKSRFNRYWEFKDYIPPELFKIFLSLCSTGHFKLSNSAMKKLALLLQKVHNQRDETFGNGRLVRNIYEATISNQSSRIVSQEEISDEALSTIEAEDIPNSISSL